MELCGRFWEAHGHYSEGRRWLEKALEKDGRASAAARAKALEGFGWLVYRVGEMNRAVVAAEEGLELSDEAGLGGAVRAKFLGLLGWIVEVQGRPRTGEGATRRKSQAQPGRR